MDGYMYGVRNMDDRIKKLGLANYKWISLEDD